MQEKYSQILVSHQAKTTLRSLFLCALVHVSVVSAMDNNGRGAKAIALANAFVAIADNPWAIAYNSAGLTQLHGIQCAAFLIPEQFGLPELRTTAFATTVPLSFTTLGLKAEQFGFDLYKETEFGIALAKMLDSSMSLGACVNLYHLSIDKYGSSSRLTLDVGMLARILERVVLGFNFSNATGTAISKNNERLPQIFTFGARWNPINNLLLTLEMEKDIRYQTSIKAGIEQKVVSIISLRAGIANNPDKYSVGFAVRYSLFEFSYAGYSHIDLGWTHQIELSFTLDT